MSAEIIFEGTAYRPDEVSKLPPHAPMREAVIATVNDWFRRSPMTITTSGSTGEPRTMQHRFEAIEASAKATARFFVLPERSSALLSLPVDKIAGKMMLYRALINNWKLILEAPGKTPLANLTRMVDFAALTPYQIRKSIELAPKSLKQARTIIIGGAPLRRSLERELQAHVHEVWETYGMTETLTHVAVRRVAPETDDYFQTLPGIEAQLSAENTLTLVSDRFASPLHTTDLIKIVSESRFEWIGRADFTINSGGFKIQPERVEDMIADLIKGRFVISSEADDALGSRVVLIIEGSPLKAEKEQRLLERIKTRVHRYEAPKRVKYITEFPMTPSGKIKRKNT